MNANLGEKNVGGVEDVRPMLDFRETNLFLGTLSTTPYLVQDDIILE